MQRIIGQNIQGIAIKRDSSWCYLGGHTNYRLKQSWLIKQIPYFDG